MVPCGKRGAKGTMERVDVESTRECTNAKSKQDKMKETATDRLEAKIFKYDLLENKILFVRLEDDDVFPSEMNGLIAMQLAARFKKPTIVARLNKQGFDRGSARGMNQSDLKDFKQFLDESGYFEYAQGHANAFGVSIDDTKLANFHKYANTALADIDFGENAYDVNFTRTAMSPDLGSLITDVGEAEQIWGQNNNQPLVHVSNITVNPAAIRIMGANADTLRIDVNGIPFIKFRAKDMIEEIQSHKIPFVMEVVGKPNLNEWMGRTSPQMFIEDYEIKENII
jgi:single-stranded-DNA-specific exonuclease